MAIKTLAGWGAAAAVVAGGLFYAFQPRPVPVDMAEIDRGPMMATVDEEGRTRVKEVYLVSAPLPGRVLRVAAKVGDPVIAGETVIAEMRPGQPAFLDERSLAEHNSAVKAAEAAKSLADAEVKRIAAAQEFAQAELRRAEALATNGTISRAALDRARMEARTQDAALQTARAGFDQRSYELGTARAALIPPSERSAAADTCCLMVRAPVSGRVLRIYRESEQMVDAGASLVEIGDPDDLEVIAELLSTDAVKVSAGDAVLIERWGGPGALSGRVQRIEPFGFTKVSALGVEEQRVNVVIDFAGATEDRARLGHGFRVEVRIVLWQSDDAVRVPVGALFQDNSGWHVFAVSEGLASRRDVEIGHLNDRIAEVLSGIEPGDTVVLHPGERIAEGVAVVARD